ncbi:Laccase-14, partial [Mucuna pruriens]
MNLLPNGIEAITQGSIKPGGKFKHKITFSTEEGTLWWHAHSDWSRVTLHGAIIVYPKKHSAYPFPKPDVEVPILLGEWWKKDVKKVYTEFLKIGGSPTNAYAITINGQPGGLYPCSKSETFKLNVDQGKLYLLRFVNAAVNHFLFFSISQHKLVVVGTDGSYTKPLTSDYICVSPGQTIDALMYANQEPKHYYMASRAYSSRVGVPFFNTKSTAILKYSGNYAPHSSPSLPFFLPSHNDTYAAFHFFGRIRGLTKKYPHKVPLNITTHIVTTLSTNTFSCSKGHSCEKSNQIASSSSSNNLGFGNPGVEILEACYYYIGRVLARDFPILLPLLFDLIEKYLPLILEIVEPGTKVRVLNYGSTVELVLQGTNMVSGIDHAMHLHGYSFHVVGYGFGKFDKHKDPIKYNLIDPTLLNTVPVPKNGWAAIRFKGTNPGTVWFMHCLLNRHVSRGIGTVFVVKNGAKGLDENLLPPP